MKRGDPAPTVPILLWFSQFYYGPQPDFWKLAPRYDVFWDDVLIQLT
jgi:hypothetical protein